MHNSDSYFPHKTICDISNDKVICNGKQKGDNMTAESSNYRTELNITKSDIGGLNDVYTKAASLMSDHIAQGK